MRGLRAEGTRAQTETALRGLASPASDTPKCVLQDGLWVKGSRDKPWNAGTISPSSNSRSPSAEKSQLTAC